jgi:hypothetical protein
MGRGGGGRGIGIRGRGRALPFDKFVVADRQLMAQELNDIRGEAADPSIV